MILSYYQMVDIQEIKGQIHVKTKFNLKDLLMITSLDYLIFTKKSVTQIPV